MMIGILKQLADEQDQSTDSDGYSPDVTIVLNTGQEVSGLLYVSELDQIVTVLRVTETEPRNNRLYADIPRHYSIDAVIGAYYTEGS